ncbi:unnamed protein product [Brassicogethes aeneus]|uniref:Uncharacterized protein n=1 Tax=Brassicogethes aeneus TaxID=1431903 RepID=A0A9P0AVB8_BRAAE|nr:unnamed protein product [Brassicogethes aeneus]
MANRRKINAEIIEIYQLYFDQNIICDIKWAPSTICTGCMGNLSQWRKGKIDSMPFGIPVIWTNPQVHNPDECYVCVNFKPGTNRKKTRSMKYIATKFVELPLPHSENVPVPKRPSPTAVSISTISETVEGGSNFDYVLTNVTPDCDHTEITQDRLDIIARRLKLSQRQTILLAKELKTLNLLAPDARVYGSIGQIQSTHFGASKGQLTIHAGVFYSKNNDLLQTGTFATVSNNLDHQAHAVWGHLKPILQKLLSTKEGVQTLHMFSDGPTSQYRNRTNIYLWIKTLIDHFPKITSATWTYSEPGHGKGPMDGVGGLLKKRADDYVLKGKDVQTAADFINLFEKSTVLVQEVTNDKIVAVKNSVPKKLDAIPGVMNVSKITWQKASDVSISLYQHVKFLKKVKLDTFARTIQNKKAEVPIDMGVSQELLSFKFNRASIYHDVYGFSSSDENLQTISDRLYKRDNELHAGTSYGQDLENTTTPGGLVRSERGLDRPRRRKSPEQPELPEFERWSYLTPCLEDGRPSQVAEEASKFSGGLEQREPWNWLQESHRPDEPMEEASNTNMDPEQPS